MSTALAAKLTNLRERLQRGEISSNEAARSLEFLEAELAALGTSVSSTATPSPFSLTADYDLTIEELVKRGSYDRLDRGVNQNKFPSDRRGKECVNAELVHSNRVASTDEAFREIAVRNLRPANVVETLTFGYTYKDEQCKYPIVGLGSSCKVRGGRCFPCLWGDGSWRELNLSGAGSGWLSSCRFLVVRK